MKLDFRASGVPLALADLLKRAAPDADDEWPQRVASEALVDVAGTAVRNLGHVVEPGERVRITGTEELLAPAVPELSLDGPSEALLVLAPAPPWPSGTLGVPGRSGGKNPAKASAFQVPFEQIERRGPLAALRLRPTRPSLRRTLDRLARCGFPVLGDVRRGGILTDVGLAVAIIAADRDADSLSPGLGDLLRWPTEPVFPEPSGGEPFSLRISPATTRVLERGHPWILRDDETGDAGRFAPGTVVALRDPHGRPHGLARVEGAGELSARIWQHKTVRLRDAESVESRVARALERRRDLVLAPTGAPETDAYRLIHGEADGLPGVAVDRLGNVLRMIESGRSVEGFRDRMLDALRAGLAPSIADPEIVVVVHGREPAPGPVEAVWRLSGGSGWDGGRLQVSERGLRFFVETGLEDPMHPAPGVGLYLDQRENRARLAEIAEARGGRWLNLFAHTGAFSVALLAGGAEEVLSVDLSGRYLRWLEENLGANAAAGVDASRHQSLKMDGRRYLLGDTSSPGSTASADEGRPFQGIVLDPPTAAAAGRRFFSVARDLEPMIAASLERLAPGGVLLVSRNQRRGRGDLRGLVSRAAEQAGVRLASVREAPPGRDFPRLRGFPEGDSFRALIATRSGG